MDESQLVAQLSVSPLPQEERFQRRMRLLQALWRRQKNLPIGQHNGKELGTRVDDDNSRRIGLNFLTPDAAQAACFRVDHGEPGDNLETGRLFGNLLASTPLAFNLFGPFTGHLDQATEVLSHLAPGCIAEVTGLLWEHNPSRQDAALSCDKTAFDVFFEYLSPSGRRGFIGIEVKYHESLKTDTAEERSRYREVAREMRCFKNPDSSALLDAPIGQLWRNHLLCGSMIHRGDYEEGVSVLLYPGGNRHCRQALAAYRHQLCDTATFDAWTIEEVVSVMELLLDWDWLPEFRHRYLGHWRLRDA